MSEQQRTSVATYLEQQLAICGKSQKQIAKEIGYANPNIMTMFKTGQTKVPIEKAPLLARSLGLDELAFLRFVMLEYVPDVWLAIEVTLGSKAPVTESELELLQLARHATNGVPLDLSSSDARLVVESALIKVLSTQQERAKAAVERYNAAPPNRRFGSSSS